MASYITKDGRFANVRPLTFLEGEMVGDSGAVASEAFELGDRGSLRLDVGIGSVHGPANQLLAFENVNGGSFTIGDGTLQSGPVSFDDMEEFPSELKAALDSLYGEGTTELDLSGAEQGEILILVLGAGVPEPLVVDGSELIGPEPGVEPSVSITLQEPADFEGTVSVQVRTSPDGESWTNVGVAVEVSEPNGRSLHGPLDRWVQVVCSTSAGVALVYVRGEAV